MQRVGHEILQNGRSAWREVPQQPGEECRIDRPMTRQPREVGDELQMPVGRAVQVIENGPWPPKADDDDRGHDPRRQQIERADRAVGGHQLHLSADDAAQQKRDEGRDSAGGIPQGTDATRHGQLLAYGRAESVPGAPQKEKTDGREQRAGEQRGLAHRDEGECREDGAGQTAEKDKIAAVAVPERIPEVAHHPESEGEIARDARPQAERRQSGCGEVQLVLEHEGQRDDVKADRRRHEVQNDNEKSGIDQDRRALRRNERRAGLLFANLYNRYLEAIHAVPEPAPARLPAKGRGARGCAIRLESAARAR